MSKVVATIIAPTLPETKPFIGYYMAWDKNENKYLGIKVEEIGGDIVIKFVDNS